jgi:hypothetical protein
VSSMSKRKLWKIPQQIGDWEVEMTWEEGQTQGGPSMLVIRPKDPERPPVGGLSSTVLRKINFRAGAELLHALVDTKSGFVEWVRHEQGKAKKPIDLVREALSEGITDHYLALLSIEYVGRVNAGQAKPVDRLAQELGRSLGTVKGHLWQARERGLLEGGSAGRKGGEISETALQLADVWTSKQGFEKQA